MSSVKELAASANKIAKLILELGEQRKHNEKGIICNFNDYRAGHLKNLVESDVKEKRTGDPTPDDKVKDPWLQNVVHLGKQMVYQQVLILQHFVFQHYVFQHFVW